MVLTDDTRISIANVLKQTVRDKLKNYRPETENMPFHYRLLGRDRYAMFSFMQSINTTFGLSLWEQVALILAQKAGHQAQRQFRLFGQIDIATETLLSTLMMGLRSGGLNPSVANMTELIRNSIKPGISARDPDSVVDLYIAADGVENYFDITTVKPNMKDFVALKHKLLRWTALRLSCSCKSNVMARLAIPYNPYAPQPYARWTLKGLYDLGAGEILVGEDFWNFVAGCSCYEELLDTFQQTGEELRSEIDNKFASLQNNCHEHPERG